MRELVVAFSVCEAAAREIALLRSERMEESSVGSDSESGRSRVAWARLVYAEAYVGFSVIRWESFEIAILSWLGDGFGVFRGLRIAFSVRITWSETVSSILDGRETDGSEMMAVLEFAERDVSGSKIAPRMARSFLDKVLTVVVVMDTGMSGFELMRRSNECLSNREMHEKLCRICKLWEVL